MVDKHSKPVIILLALTLIACNAQAFSFEDITKQLPDTYHKTLGALLIIPALTVLVTLLLLKIA